MPYVKATLDIEEHRTLAVEAAKRGLSMQALATEIVKEWCQRMKLGDQPAPKPASKD